MTDAIAPPAPATSTQRPWLNAYPPGVPGEVAVDTYSSLVPLLEESWRTYAKRDAAACMGVRITYGEVDERSKALGAWLQSQGVKRGDRVAVMMPNVPQYLVAIGAILRIGGVVVNVNP